MSDWVRTAAPSIASLRNGNTISAMAPEFEQCGSADPVPTWVETWSQAAAIGLAECPSDDFAVSVDPDSPDSAEPLPFEEILIPFLAVARQRLTGPRSRTVRLEPAAYAQLERLLLRRLSAVSAGSLLVEFTAYRWKTQSPLGRLLDRAAEDASRRVYDSFVQYMLTDGFVPFFQEFPVLARLAARVTDLWVDATTELLERLDRDYDQLGRVFSPGIPLGAVTSLEPGLSDPHAGGRMVMQLTFASGTRIAYKPKDIGTEFAFGRLLSWLNDRGSPLPLRQLKVLAFRGYGWVEWVELTPCRDEGQVRDYYQRAGMLLCLVYVLGGTDCHCENLIACGEHPVLIDTESLMHHRVVPEAEPGGAFEAAVSELRAGVLGTGLLPSWCVDDDDESGTAWDISALHTAENEEAVLGVLNWDGVNTDRMAMRWNPAAISVINSINNQPYLDETPVRLSDYADSLVEGFERCYRFLMEQSADLLARGSPLDELTTQRVRFLYRNTRVYGSLLRQLADPRYMRHEHRRRAELERLAAALDTLPLDNQAAFRPIIDAEIDALQDMDIPFFWAEASSVRLESPSRPHIDGCLAEPSAERVVDRLRGLSLQDMQRQIGFIAGSLHANTARHHGPLPQSPAARHRFGGLPEGVDFDVVAGQLACQIANSAIRTPSGGGATWIAPQYLPRLERYQLQPVGYDLHSGARGLALFLAAVDRVTSDGRHEELVLEALQSLRQAVSEDPSVLMKTLRFGAATGIGSIVYGLTRIATLSGNRDLLTDACAVAAVLDEEAITSAPLDVFSGLAGEILGLLTLYESVPEPHILAGAIACGRRVVSEIRPAPTGGRAWRTSHGQMLTGFSHGAAGIAYALLRLFAETGDDVFRIAAEDAITYEDALFDPASRNWPDLREEDQPAYKCNWCHGAPGIGLARLGGLRVMSTPRVAEDIQAALSRTASMGLDGPDHLCCGNVGRIELFLAAGARLDPDVANIGRQRLEQIVGRAYAEGQFSLHSSLPARVEFPGLFMGTSGIGYQLLRCAHPQLIPSVLLWE